MRNDVREALDNVETARVAVNQAFKDMRDNALPDGRYDLYRVGETERKTKAYVAAKAEAFDVLMETTLPYVLGADSEDVNTLAYLVYDFGMSMDEDFDRERSIDLLDVLKRFSLLLREFDDNDVVKNIVSLRDEIIELQEQSDPVE